jgi:hypothetical protein
LWNHGYFGAEGTRSFVFLNLWPIVEAILRRLDDPMRLEAHGAGYEVIRWARDHFRVRDEAEREVLGMIRSGNYVRVEVTAPDGTIHTIKTTREVDSEADLEQLLGEEDYQQVTVTKRGGKPHITQTVTKKPPRTPHG